MESTADGPSSAPAPTPEGEVACAEASSSTDGKLSSPSALASWPGCSDSSAPWLASWLPSPSIPRRELEAASSFEVPGIVSGAPTAFAVSGTKTSAEAAIAEATANPRPTRNPAAPAILRIDFPATNPTFFNCNTATSRESHSIILLSQISRIGNALATDCQSLNIRFTQATHPPLGSIDMLTNAAFKQIGLVAVLSRSHPSAPLRERLVGYESLIHEGPRL